MKVSCQGIVFLIKNNSDFEKVTQYLRPCCYFIPKSPTLWSGMSSPMVCFLICQRHSTHSWNLQILLSKLYYYGLRGCVLNWFASYLAGHKQLTEFNGSRPMFSDVICGVPQGSILGPLLCIIYINDLHNSSSMLTFFYKCVCLWQKS